MFRTAICKRARATRPWYRRRTDCNIWMHFQIRKLRLARSNQVSTPYRQRKRGRLQYRKQRLSRLSTLRIGMINALISIITKKAIFGSSGKVRGHMRQRRKWKLRSGEEGDQVNHRSKLHKNRRMDSSWLTSKLRKWMVMDTIKRCRRCITIMRIRWTHTEKRFCSIMESNQVTADWAYPASIRSIGAKGTRPYISKHMVARSRSRTRRKTKSKYSRILYWTRSSARYQSTQTLSTTSQSSSSKSNKSRSRTNTGQWPTRRTRQPWILSGPSINPGKYQDGGTWNLIELGSSRWSQG